MDEWKVGETDFQKGGGEWRKEERCDMWPFSLAIFFFFFLQLFVVDDRVAHGTEDGHEHAQGAEWGHDVLEDDNGEHDGQDLLHVAAYGQRHWRSLLVGEEVRHVEQPCHQA